MKTVDLFFLTKEEKEAVYQKIFQEMSGDDLYPYEVIRNNLFNGDEEKYLTKMAAYHGTV